MSLFVMLLIALSMGCGSKASGPGGGGDAGNSSDSLSADLIAFKTGKESQYEDRRFLVNKSDKAVSHTTKKGLIRVESSQAFTTSNKLDPDVLVIKLYTQSQQKKGPDLICSGEFGDELLPIKREGNDVKLLLQIYPKQVWTTFIKGGAKPGEKWESVDGNIKCRSEYLERSGGDSGFVVEQMISQNNHLITKRRWYFGNSGGAMRLDIYGSGKGDASKYWVPLRQLICDDWKGDRSPLELGEIKPSVR